jgi:hypothetical protein
MDMSVYRRISDNESKEVSRHIVRRAGNSVEFGNPYELPTLEWGDVFVVCYHDPNTQFRPPPPPKATAAEPSIRNVTVQVGDREGAFGLFGTLDNNQGWDPSTGRIPEFRFSQLVEKIARAEPRVQLEAVKVQRTIDGKPMEWAVDLRTEQVGKVKDVPARLADGDRVVVSLRAADAPDVVKNRKSGIYCTSPDRIFGECVFRFHEKDNAPRTLCELIAEVYRNSPMVIVDPDLTKIRIRRLKPADDSEDVLIVNLATIAGNVTAKSTKEEVQRLDFPLQWGDIVEIAPTKRDNPAVWTEFDDQFKLFLSKALARSVQVTGSEPQVFVGFRPSYGSFFAMMPPMNHFVRRQGPPGSGFRALGNIKVGGNVAKVRLESGNSVREFSLNEFNAVNPWLKDGDRIEIVRY